MTKLMVHVISNETVVPLKLNYTFLSTIVYPK